jgi:proline dehydrogenase
MMRRFLLYMSQARWARRIVTCWPVARRVARRFVAGETLDEAIQATQTLNDQGLWATLDYLGESVSSAAETEQVVAVYTALIDRINAGQLQASVSLKLTHLGLDIAEDLCVTNLRHILAAAQVRNVQVTIDMEGSAYTAITLRIFRTMRHDYGYENIGAVIQSYLYRSEEDMRELAAEGAHVRLVKGAYLEPPEIAYPAKADVDAAYHRSMLAYLQAPPPAYLCIATHDEKLISAAVDFVREHSVPNARYEYQMLYGIRASRQLELAQAGYPVRVYMPFGAAWYPYMVRRLAERPANLWFFARSFFRR